MKFVVVAFTLGLFLTVPGMLLLRLISLESVVQRLPVWLLPEGHLQRMTVLFVQFFIAQCVVTGLVLVLVFALVRRR